LSLKRNRIRGLWV